MDQTTRDSHIIARVDNPREVIPRTHYMSGMRVSTSYVNVLPHKLQLCRNFIAGRFKREDTTNTLFHDVSIVPLHLLYDPMARRALVTTSSDEFVIGQFPPSSELVHTPLAIDEDEEQLLARVQQALKDVVYNSWDPWMQHVVLHSSGLDSRMLSWTIRELYEEHGNEWLGDVLFVCSKWEVEEFKKIMACEGWSQDQYYAPNEILDDDEYYFWSLLDFDGAWERANGVSAMPVNLFWYLVDWAQHDGRCSLDNVQTYNGHLGNTVLDSTTAKAICKLRRKFYYSVMCMRPMKGDEAYLPFADVSMVDAILQSSVKLGRKLRPQLLRFMNPVLAKFENVHANGDRHRPISQRIMARVMADYRNSWYGSVVHPEAQPNKATTEFQDFWSHWTAASLCEHLLNCGYDIEVV